MDIITLINTLVSGLLNAEEEFLEHLDSFTTFEETVSSLSNQMAADFIGLALTNADQMIRDSGIRKGSYTVQRSRQRTLISIVGDITFMHTLYKDQMGKSRCLLDELMHLPDRERFTAAAEAKLLNEAEVHSIEKEIPEMEEPPKEKKACEYLYIEADEDHIHRQKDGKERDVL